MLQCKIDSWGSKISIPTRPNFLSHCTTFVILSHHTFNTFAARFWKCATMNIEQTNSFICWLFNFDSAISMPKKLEPCVLPTVHPNSLPQVLAKKKPLSWAQLILICLGPNNPNMHEHLPTCAKGRRGPTLGSVLIDGVEAVQTRTPHNSPIWKWSMMWELHFHTSNMYMQ